MFLEELFWTMMTQTLLRIVSQTAFLAVLVISGLYIHPYGMLAAYRLQRWPAVICHKLNLNLAKTRLSFVNFRLLVTVFFIVQS